MLRHRSRCYKYSPWNEPKRRLTAFNPFSPFLTIVSIVVSFDLCHIIALTLTQIVNMHANRTEELKLNGLEWNGVDTTRLDSIRFELYRGELSELGYRCTDDTVGMKSKSTSGQGSICTDFPSHRDLPHFRSVVVPRIVNGKL